MTTRKFSGNARNGKSQPIYAGGHVVGQVKNGTFYKSIAANHYLRQPPAIAFSLQSLEDALRAGSLQVEVKDRDTGTIYRATIDYILEKGFPVNRAGFEPQIALSLDMWTIQAKRTSGKPWQPGLFGG